MTIFGVLIDTMDDTLGFAYLHFENNKRDELLDGLSPADIHTVLYDLFNLKSPFGFKRKIEDEVFHKVDLFNWTELIISKLKKQESININEIYNWPQSSCDISKIATYLPEEYQNYSKESAFWIFLMEKAGIFRNADGVWTASKRINRLDDDPRNILKFLIEGVGFRINWSVFDGKSAMEMGQLAFGISLIMLIRYGDEYRDVKFYAAKYLHFFDLVRDIPDVPHPKPSIDLVNIYIFRTFYCFAQIFELVEMREVKSNEGVETQVKSSDIFKELFTLNY